MDTSLFQPTVYFAIFGAIGIKLVELAELRSVPKASRPDFGDLLYWLPFLVSPIIGGGLAYMYIMSKINLEPVIAVNVGVSGPLILRAMAQLIPIQPKPIDPGQGA
jgi:hypothetical protein